jgi:hypothetical protein
MQITEELSQKGQTGVKKCVTRGGKNIFFGRGEGLIPIIFRLKYRPLVSRTTGSDM